MVMVVVAIMMTIIVVLVVVEIVVEVVVEIVVEVVVEIVVEVVMVVIRTCWRKRRKGQQQQNVGDGQNSVAPAPSALLLDGARPRPRDG